MRSVTSKSSICAPSASLAPFPKLFTLSSTQVCQSLDNLRQIYGRRPPALPSKLVLPIRKHRQVIHDDSVPDSGYASAEDESEAEEEEYLVSDFSSDNESADVLRADPVERAFAIRWLTGFIARSDEWASGDDISEAGGDKRTESVEIASQLLSLLLTDEREDEEDCSVTRSFQFPAQGGRTTIEVELNDAPLLSEDHTSVGLQSWASSIVLSEKLCTEPLQFSLSTKDDGMPLRILELGAGTGLLSIVAAKILSASTATTATTSASIFATDYHPDVLVNLRANIATNFSSSSVQSPPPISVYQLDWESPDYSDPMDKPFDLILGADLIYHPDHARWIKACVERLLLRPSASAGGGSGEGCAGGIFWLMMALRISGRHEGLFRTVEDIFPDVSSSSSSSFLESNLTSSRSGAGTDSTNRSRGVDAGTEGQDGSGIGISKDGTTWQLAILEKTEFDKMKGIGRADERGYLLFKIGWALC